MLDAQPQQPQQPQRSKVWGEPCRHCGHEFDFWDNLNTQCVVCGQTLRASLALAAKPATKDEVKNA